MRSYCFHLHIQTSLEMIDLTHKSSFTRNPDSNVEKPLLTYSFHTRTSIVRKTVSRIQSFHTRLHHMMNLDLLNSSWSHYNTHTINWQIKKQKYSYLPFFLISLRASSDLSFLLKLFFKKNSCLLHSCKIPDFLTADLNLRAKSSDVSPSLRLTIHANLLSPAFV